MLFGDKLLQLLDEREISQKKFAAALNIAPTTLNGYIKNKRQPDFDMVKRIASILSVSTDYLLDYNGVGITLSAKELSLISALREMGDNERNVIYDLVDITAERSGKNK